MRRAPSRAEELLPPPPPASTILTSLLSVSLFLFLPWAESDGLRTWLHP